MSDPNTDGPFDRDLDLVFSDAQNEVSERNECARALTFSNPTPNECLIENVPDCMTELLEMPDQAAVSRESEGYETPGFSSEFVKDFTADEPVSIFQGIETEANLDEITVPYRDPNMVPHGSFTQTFAQSGFDLSDVLVNFESTSSNAEHALEFVQNHEWQTDFPIGTITLFPTKTERYQMDYASEGILRNEVDQSMNLLMEVPIINCENVTNQIDKISIGARTEKYHFAINFDEGRILKSSRIEPTSEIIHLGHKMQIVESSPSLLENPNTTRISRNSQVKEAACPYEDTNHFSLFRYLFDDFSTLRAQSFSDRPPSSFVFIMDINRQRNEFLRAMRELDALIDRHRTPGVGTPSPETLRLSFMTPDSQEMREQFLPVTGVCFI